MRPTFDPDDPPAEPPPGCVSPTIWRLTYRLHRSHRPVDTDRCGCGEPFPCPSRRLVGRGFLAAIGMSVGAGQPDLLDRLTKEER